MGIEPVVSTTAGTKLYVSETLPTSDSLAAFQAVTGWIEVTEVTDMGEINETYNSVEHVSIDRRKTQTLKGVKGAVAITWQLGRVVSDAGQAILVAHKDSDEYLSYKEVHLDGTVYYCAGPVMGLVTGYGGADTVKSRSLTVAVNTNVYEDVTAYHTITYVAGANGVIAGKTTQTIANGADGEPVVAVALTGYNFSAWSDSYSKPAGIAEAGYRIDENVAASATRTATFVAE